MLFSLGEMSSHQRNGWQAAVSGGSQVQAQSAALTPALTHTFTHHQTTHNTQWLLSRAILQMSWETP